MTTPDMSAETCDGAAACAPGSQMWNGIAPALRPHATIKSQKTARPSAVPAAPDERSANRHVPVMECRRVTTAKRASVATWLAARYSHEALRASESTLSVPTRKNDASATISHIATKKIVWLATMSSASAPESTPKKQRTYAARGR